MKDMTLRQIAAAIRGELHYGAQGYSAGDAKADVAGVVLDSRKCDRDYLFIATVGERVDGHDFVGQVMEKGAAAAVVEKVPSVDCTYILVEDSFKALKDLAAWYRSRLDVRIVGIVGSVGKTSTKEFVASVLSVKYKTLKTEGNLNNEVGMPLTILKIREEHEVAVIEMGISDFGEMTRLAEIARPDYAIYTNIGQCHLENLKTREGILQAKTELLPYLKADAPVIINGDDDMLVRIGETRAVIPYGRGENCKVRSLKEEPKGLFGTDCVISDDAGSFEVHVPLPGAHMVLNALAATAAGRAFRMTNGEIRQGIEACRSVGGRSNIISTGHYTLIDDCYNANPVSMKAAIDLLSLADTRKVAVLGDMFELGADEASLHADVGAYAAAKGIDLILATGKLSLHMYNAAKEKSAGEVRYFESREELLRALHEEGLLRINDTILIKASHGMGFQAVVESLSSL